MMRFVNASLRDRPNCDATSLIFAHGVVQNDKNLSRKEVLRELVATKYETWRGMGRAQRCRRFARNRRGP